MVPSVGHDVVDDLAEGGATALEAPDAERLAGEVDAAKPSPSGVIATHRGGWSYDSVL